jgi:parvulin-like peptidyl-prolyl isomerase
MVDKERIQAANLGRRNRGSHLAQDKRKKRVVFILAAIIAVLVIAIPVYGWVTTFIMPPRETIVRVNDTSYDMAYLLKIIRMVQRQSEASGQQVNLGTIPFQLVNNLAEDELIAQGAQAIGLTVTDEELNSQLRSEFLVNVDTGAGLSDADLNTEFRERYRQFLNQIQLSASEYEAIVTRNLYRDKLEEHLGAAIPKELPQIHLFALAVQTQEIAEEVRTQYLRGTPFAELVAEHSVDPEAVRLEGEVDWVPRGVLDPLIAEFVFDELETGVISEPLPQFDSASSQEFFVLYYVPEREDLREVSDNNFVSLRNEAVNDWVQAQRDLNEVFTSFDSNQYAWLAKKLRLTTILQ